MLAASDGPVHGPFTPAAELRGCFGGTIRKPGSCQRSSYGCRVEICLLGELEVWHSGAPVQVRGVKQRALLALLALQRGAPAGVDRLVEGVWGDEVPANGLNALRMQIAQLRRAVGADAVVTTGAGYVLVGVDVDVVRFEQLVAQGRALLAVGDVSGADSLRQALAMRRGEPLAEFASFDFAVAERARLNELGVLAVEARIAADLALGRHADVIGELEGLCREHPLREGLWVLRMTALYRVGRQAEALRCFTEARERLAEELGIAPGAELQRAEAMVLAHDPALDLNIGADVASPQRQLRRSHLRASLTSFIGRDEEVVELCARSRRARLVTLIGPGGVGKTRLAVEAARWSGVDGGAGRRERSGRRRRGCRPSPRCCRRQRVVGG
jgi:DNA-binding SARP family transcriptional activator